MTKYFILRIRTAIALGIALLLPPTAGSAEPTYEEIRAGYEKNLRALGAFRVVVRERDSSTPEHLVIIKERAAKLEKALSKGDSGDRTRLREMLSRLKSQIEWNEKNGPNAYHESRAALTIGKESLQVVVPNVRTEGKDFPITNLRTSADLVSFYPEHLVLSWSPDQVPNSWMWQGTHKDELYASVSDETPCQVMEFPVPPLGLWNLDVISDRECSALDQPFRRPFDATTVLGTEDLQGVQTIVFECQTADDRSVLKVWVDPQRGYTPLQIHRDHEAKRPDAKRPGPFEIVTVSEIRQVAEQVWYPISWIIDGRQDDRRNWKPGQLEPAPIYSYRLATWTVESITPSVTEPLPLFEVGLPRGTRCYDQQQNQYTVIEEDETEHTKQSKLLKQLPKLQPVP